MSSKTDRGRLLRAHNLPNGPCHEEDSFGVDSKDPIIIVRVGLIERNIRRNIHLWHPAVSICEHPASVSMSSVMATHPEGIDAIIDTTEAFYGKCDHGIHRSGMCDINRGRNTLIVRIGCQSLAFLRSFVCALGINIREQCAFDPSFSKSVCNLSSNTAGRLCKRCKSQVFRSEHERRGSWWGTYANDEGNSIKSKLGHDHGAVDPETKQLISRN